MSDVRANVLTSAILAALAFATSACASSGGATCPDLTPAPHDAPVCAPPPPAARPPVTIGLDTMPTDREQRVSLVALSQDGLTALLRIEDEVVGDLFKTVDLSTGPVPKLQKTWLFQSLTEPIARKQALRSIKPKPTPPSQTNQHGVTLLASDAGEHIVIFAMKGERAVSIATLPRLRDADGVLSDVSVIKLAWDPTGTRAIIIHAQRLAATPGFASQWLHVLPVAPATLPF